MCKHRQEQGVVGEPTDLPSPPCIIINKLNMKKKEIRGGLISVWLYTEVVVEKGQIR
jgi:hypothetical protein